MRRRRDAERPPAAVAPGTELYAFVVADHMADGAVVVRARDGLILYTNSSWDDMLGYRHGALLGQGISTVFAATDDVPERRAREIDDALRSDGIWRGLVKNVRNGGQQFWCDTSVTRSGDPEHGSVWVIVQRDARRRMVLEDRRDETAELFRTLFEASPTPSLVVTEGLIVRDVNESFWVLLGGDWRDLVGSLVTEITGFDDTALDAELIAGAFDTDRPVLATRRQLTRTGSEVIDVDSRVKVLSRQAAGKRLALVTVTPCEVEPDAVLRSRFGRGGVGTAGSE